MIEIWWEKHRPTSLDEFVGQDDLVNEVRSIITGVAPMQHLLFHSPEPGTGKTTLAYIMAEALGYQLHKFNASSKRQRGIEFIEEDIVPMSRIGQWETIFFLDEADRLTPQAQDALKGVIEDAQGYFILTCNDLSRVSPWLQSRCQVRTLEKIPDDLVEKRLALIAAREGVEVDDHSIRVIASKHRGDLRNAIGALQTISYLGVGERAKAIHNLEAPDFSAQRVLKLAMSEKAIDEAVKELIGSTPSLTRERIRAVFEYAIESSADKSKKLRVLDAAMTCERDIIDGCESYMVAYNFCYLLSQSKSPL
jgi:DNA polymerase III delta prime subunit